MSNNNNNNNNNSNNKIVGIVRAKIIAIVINSVVLINDFVVKYYTRYGECRSVYLLLTSPPRQSNLTYLWRH